MQEILECVGPSRVTGDSIGVQSNNPLGCIADRPTPWDIGEQAPHTGPGWHTGGIRIWLGFI